MIKIKQTSFDMARKLAAMFYLEFCINKERVKKQVGKDQEKAQSEKDSHFKNRGGKKQK